MKICEQCDKQIKDDEPESGYAVYDPVIRNILGMTDTHVLYFHPKCLEKWKEDNAPLLASSQR